MATPRKLDIEVHRGRIVAVWYGCIALPFQVVEVDEARNRELTRSEATYVVGDEYHAIEYFDQRLKETLAKGVNPQDLDSPIGRDTGE